MGLAWHVPLRIRRRPERAGLPQGKAGVKPPEHRRRAASPRPRVERTVRRSLRSGQLWAWNADFNCSSGPGLITDYNGDPTGYGAGVESHLKALAGG